MPQIKSAFHEMTLAGGGGLRVSIDDRGCVRRLDCGDTLVNLFVANGIENGPLNLHLRFADSAERTALLGPGAPTQGRRVAENRWLGSGRALGLQYTLALTLARDTSAWFWHLHVQNTTSLQVRLDAVYTQDIGLAPYGMARLNEYYISQYVDHTALEHGDRGWLIASRQNLAAAGRNAWSLVGSLRRAVRYATDALQVFDRLGSLVAHLPSHRLQHEHSLAALQDEPVTLGPQESVIFGFFGLFRADHPLATSLLDLGAVKDVLDLPEASSELAFSIPPDQRGLPPSTLFASAPRFESQEFEATALRALFPGRWRHKECDDAGNTLSFFHGENRHVVLREKERRVLRPHGHLLRTGVAATPDEGALTSTVWMKGVFHSMLTQGHVSFNRLLSTTHSYLGLFRSHGQRVFVDIGHGWQLLDEPSAFEMTPTACRWLYRRGAQVIEVVSEARSDPQELLLDIRVQSGSPIRCLISHHLALNGDDGSEAQPVRWNHESGIVTLRPAAGTALAERFPEGHFRIVAESRIARVGGDELLHSDEQSRQQPYVCIVTERAERHSLRLRGFLVSMMAPPDAGNRIDEQSALPRIECPAESPSANRLSALVDILPWYAHNALIHYLAPRGLEQYSGGGWGTRDVTQGPLEMLLALGKDTPVRDLILRVLAAQNPDGDWPQWFMFFERDRHVRPGDSHGDIVFWPVLALAQYLLASGDAAILDEGVPFFNDSAPATVWEHVERALGVIRGRVIPNTTLAAYGHGDWNDSLQPADPAMRESLCSAWTVTLHFQTLSTLARALRAVGKSDAVQVFDSEAARIRDDFQRMLLPNGVLTGYVMFDGASPRYLLHPRDETTGVRYSSLAMIHALLEGLFTPEQARAHLAIIREHLLGPDGVRLFDRPMPYHGGPQKFFQRAESATFFGREIGLMYMHAHLRYAQALAHVGDAQAFFVALCQANPIGLQEIVPTAALRQANCYYSSSDAAFADRHEAGAEYGRINKGTISLEGGWRVYSSGAGIALGLFVRRFLGLGIEFGAIVIDPVMPQSLSGLKARTRLHGHEIEVMYRIGPAGCGVTSIVANGNPVQFTLDANPYRTGAARIALPSLSAHLRDGLNELVVVLG